MTKVEVTWKGIRPFIMHSAALADPDNEYVQRKNLLTRQKKKLKKDDEDGHEKKRREIENNEWLGALYWDSTVGLYVPGPNIFRCIADGAKSIKAGKRAEAALLPIDDVVPVIGIDYPRDVNALYKLKEFSFRHIVRIPPKQGPRIMIVRPIIPAGWQLNFTAEFDEQHLPLDDFKEANHYAGTILGIGAWRPRFGRFLPEFKS